MTGNPEKKSNITMTDDLFVWYCLFNHQKNNPEFIENRFFITCNP